MGFWVTSLTFLLAGVIASLSFRLCCNRGPSTNLNPLELKKTGGIVQEFHELSLSMRINPSTLL
ncbi:V-type H+-transporting ATPase subunit H [Apostasia shenzhenica]|uniref:V-type H+-transporting ATPase subunit H n=1 Tax=Apostasia shenzhenica TaxID=1088818 RepID=A0A2H9ZX38_9ASPA|nr:V-type H+-transporting ATPase subunit H [Apostasia shenzhenica]